MEEIRENGGGGVKISFDLDETLFVPPTTHEVEPKLPHPFDLLYKERLRKGTVRLIRQLRDEGFEVWVYTSSYRSVRYIRNLFRSYHVTFDGIINGEMHEKFVQRNKPYPLPTKMPNFFQISLHIDDEDCVVQNGKVYGFPVFQVGPQDDQWAEKIIAEAHRIQKLEELKRK